MEKKKQLIKNTLGMQGIWESGPHPRLLLLFRSCVAVTSPFQHPAGAPSWDCNWSDIRNGHNHATVKAVLQTESLSDYILQTACLAPCHALNAPCLIFFFSLRVWVPQVVSVKNNLTQLSSIQFMYSTAWLPVFERHNRANFEWTSAAVIHCTSASHLRCLGCECLTWDAAPRRGCARSCLLLSTIY